MGDGKGNQETKGNEVIWGHVEFDNLVEYTGGDDMYRAIRNTVLEHQRKGDIKADNINWEGHQHRGGNLSPEYSGSHPERTLVELTVCFFFSYSPVPFGSNKTYLNIILYRFCLHLKCFRNI